MVPVAGPVASEKTSTPIYSPAPVHPSLAAVKPVATPPRAAPAWVMPDAPVSAKPSGRVGRLSNAQKTEYDRNTAKALAAAQAASRAAEQSVKLAAMAQKQAAQTAAQMALRQGARTASPLKSLPSPLPVEDAKADKEAKEEPADLAPEEPADLESEKEMQSPPEKKLRGSKDTFAGHRPPKSGDKLEEFKMKKDLFVEGREELKKRFPGKEVLISRTAKQTEYWTYVRDFLKAKFPKTKNSERPSKEKIQAALKEAAEKWRQRLEKTLSTDVKKRGGSLS